MLRHGGVSESDDTMMSQLQHRQIRHALMCGPLGCSLGPGLHTAFPTGVISDLQGSPNRLLRVLSSTCPCDDHKVNTIGTSKRRW
jgi:hypothetical protein